VEVSFTDLVEHNPWWKGRNAILDDDKVQTFEASKIKWQPRLGHFFRWDSDLIYTLRGPRQVGKTTLLKLLIRKLLLVDGVQPAAVFYYNCDIIGDYKELVAVLETYLQWARTQIDGRVYVFLDEITSPKDWQRAIKAMVDEGKLRNATLLLTGSHTLDLRDAAERLPGRRGLTEDVLDKILAPMKFSEFVETTSPNGLDPVVPRNREARMHVIHELFDSSEMPRLLSKMAPLVEELNRTLDTYLVTGGMPLAINQFFTSGEIPSYVYQIYVDAVLGDMYHYRKKDRELRQVTRGIIRTLTTPVSWSGLARQTDLRGDVVRSYVDALERTFVVHYFYNLRLKTMCPEYRDDKKIYFSDPLIFHAMRAWASGNPEPFKLATEYVADQTSRGMLLESVLADHMIRLAFNMRPSGFFDYKERVLFWRSKKSEVDFNILLDGKVLSVELRSSRHVRAEDARGFWGLGGKRSGKGLILSTDQLRDFQGYRVVPISLFLLLI